MATLNVGPGGYSSIRAALIAAGNGDTINITSGTWDITYPGYNNSLTYSAAPNCSTGFINGVVSLDYTGAGKTASIISNARLFQQNVDGTAPMSVSYANLGFNYSGGSGYILSTNATSVISLNSLAFTGTHSGNAGANGNYSDVRNVSSYALTNSDISLTGQAGFTPSTGAGGSSFLMAQGDSINISGNNFDESGYRNAISIFNSSNVMVSNNTFSRTLPSTSRNVRSGGEKLKDSTGTVMGNNFLDGSYLAIEKTGGSSTVSISSNLFAQFSPTGTPIPNPINGGGAVGIVLQGASAASALGTVTANKFSYVAPFANTTGSAITVNGPTNIYVDPITNLNKSFSSYFVGGTGADALTGTSSAEYFIGGAGSDTITTGGGADFILFNTTLGASNVDTITGFNTDSRIILDRKIFTGISATYNGTIGSSIGAVNNSVQVENNTTGIASNAATRIIYNTNTGSLFYDQDGSGSTYSPIEFAKLYSSGTTPYNSNGMVGFNGSNLTSVNIGII